ncbi:outer membrane lipoprotein LolB [Marinomonas hwangdonensis]|uniref:Outer-membrane lipoprotein LolB n=1 Tax=Marinomonas hwangdonensis TaxID=1053647 RepID=A0A3M8Q9N4_9GAMM|nr:lipoprotein insertase outer membrane protein LolB [Marinomonas hwangdonensis]RNF52787.1 outer membrane lipoprotein LolB [Marinomonas hwangdonensis]
MKPYRILGLLALTALISACSTQSKGPITPPPSSVEAISHWETSGRVGIRTENDAISGNFDWQKTPSTFSLNIIGPFGQGATSLKKTTEGKVTLAYENTQVTGTSAAELLQQELGWAFPVEQVTYWIRGLASPYSPARIERDSATNNISNIKQDGWVISYRNFSQVNGLLLPQRMQVSNPPFNVNLIINQWTIQ